MTDKEYKDFDIKNLCFKVEEVDNRKIDNEKLKDFLEVELRKAFNNFPKCGYNEMFIVFANLLNILNLEINELINIFEKIGFTFKGEDKNVIEYIKLKGYKFKSYRSIIEFLESKGIKLTKEQKDFYKKFIDLCLTYLEIETIEDKIIEKLLKETKIGKIEIRDKEVDEKDKEKVIKKYLKYVLRNSTTKLAFLEDEVKHIAVIEEKEIDKVREIAVQNELIIDIDFDNEDKEVNERLAKEIFEKLKIFNLNIVMFYTGGKGYHISILLPYEEIENIILMIVEDILGSYRDYKIELLTGSKVKTLPIGKHRKGSSKEIVKVYFDSRVLTSLTYNQFEKIVDYFVEEDILKKVILKNYQLHKEIFKFLNNFDFNYKLENSKKEKIKELRKKLKEAGKYLVKIEEDLEDRIYYIPQEVKEFLVVLNEEVKEINKEIEVKGIEEIENKEFVEFIKQQLEKIEELEKYYKKEYGDIEDVINFLNSEICIFDYETQHKDKIAHNPILAVYYYRKLKKLYFWIKDLKETKIYKYKDYTIILTNDIRLAITPKEIEIYSKIKEHLETGNYEFIYLLELLRNVKEIINVDYIKELLEENTKFYKIGFNILYDIYREVYLLKKLKNKGKISLEDREFIELKEDVDIDVNKDIDIEINNIKLRYNIRKEKVSSRDIVTGSFKVNSLSFKIIDVQNLSNKHFLASLKVASKGLNKFFQKLDFEASNIEEVDEEVIKYCLVDVLATYELIYSTIFVDVFRYVKNKEFKVKKENEEIILKPEIRLRKTVSSENKAYFESLIKGKEQTYLYYSNYWNYIFKNFYYGGLVEANIGIYRNKGYYVDFNSLYPNIMNFIGIEDKFLRFAYEGYEIVEIDKEMENIWDIVEKASSYNELLRELFKQYFNGYVVVSTKIDFIIDKKLKINKKEVKILDGDKGDNRETLLSKGKIVIDLISFISNLYMLKKKGYKVSKLKKKIKVEEGVLLKIKKDVEIKGSCLYKDLIDKRNEIKNEIKDLKNKGANEEIIRLLDKEQLAYKIFANSAYGIFANDDWKYKNYVIASTITSIARYSLRVSELIFKNKGYKIAYKDTDSLFIIDEIENEDKFLEVLEEVNEEIGFTRFKIEDKFKKLVIFRRKAYLYENEEGELKYKESVKASYRNVPEEFIIGVYKYLETLNKIYGKVGHKKIRNITLSSSKSGEQKNLAKVIKYTSRKYKELIEKGYYKEEDKITTFLVEKDNLRNIFFNVVDVVDVEGNRYKLIYLNEEDRDKVMEKLGLEYEYRIVEEVIKKSYNDNKIIKLKYGLTATEILNYIQKGIILEDKPIEKYLNEDFKARKYKGIILLNYEFEKHTVDFDLTIKHKETSSYLDKVEVRDKALTYLYNVSKKYRLFNNIEKKANKLIFKYKLNDNGVSLGNGLEDYDGIIIVDLLENRKNERKVRITIHKEYEDLRLYFKDLKLVIEAFIEQVKLLLKYVGFEYKGNGFKALLESKIAYEYLREFIEEIKKVDVKISRIDIKEDVKTSKTILETFKRIFNRLTTEYLLRYEKEKGKQNILIGETQTNTYFSIKDYLNINIYDRNESLLFRKRNRVKTKLDNDLYRDILEEYEKQNIENVVRIEIAIFGHKNLYRFLDVIEELIKQIKEFLKLDVDLIGSRIIRELIFNLSKYYDKLVEDVKDVSDIVELHRHTICNISSVLAVAKNQLSKFINSYRTKLTNIYERFKFKDFSNNKENGLITKIRDRLEEIKGLPSKVKEIIKDKVVKEIDEILNEIIEEKIEETIKEIEVNGIDSIYYKIKEQSKQNLIKEYEESDYFDKQIYDDMLDKNTNRIEFIRNLRDWYNPDMW